MPEAGPETPDILIEMNVGVPVRDGVVLRANIFRPDVPSPCPGLLTRTPYGKAESGLEPLVRAGYAVVAQDSRGRYASDGEYVPFTVERTQDGEDGYDSVEWLAAQPFCNGKVGTFGVSYNGWMQWSLARLRPPHLVAMCANSIPLEITDLDWWGSFRPGRRVKWWMNSMAPDLRRRHGLPPPHTPEEAEKIWDEQEQMRWIWFLPWMDLPGYLPPGLREYARDWLRNPTRRAWRFDRIHREVEVPNLDFSGWYDHCNGSIRHLRRMQQNARTKAAREQTRLVIGPWNHKHLGERSLGSMDYGPEARVELTQVMIRWFDHWLKGDGDGLRGEPPVRYFVMGSQVWKGAATWPPEDGVGWREFYLDNGGDAHRPDGSGRLSASVPARSREDAYDYDPKDPVPTLWSQEMFTQPSDRSALAHRRDILNYRTGPLEQEVEVVGYPEAVLFASTSARDTDFFVRLVDEHPDGRALDVSYGMVRARHRISMDREDLVTPGEVVEYRIELGPTACRFLEGHRIRVEITSSDFPNHDRNHNTGGNDLAETELVTARQVIHHSRCHPSRIVLPVALEFTIKSKP